MSTEQKRFAGDALFVFQLLMAWWFTIPQVIRSLSTTQGMTITWSLLCTAFVVMNLFLALGAYRHSRSRKAGQIVLVYANWILLWGTLMTIMLFRGTWFERDSILTVLVASSLIVLLVVRRRETLSETVSEPITRGIIALLLKSVPQLFMAYCFIAAGRKDSLSGISLVVGHITIAARLWEIALAAKQDGWTRRNVGLLISETGNELSWLVTTAVWLYY